jgi:hypothetical protein
VRRALSSFPFFSILRTATSTSAGSMSAIGSLPIEPLSKDSRYSQRVAVLGAQALAPRACASRNILQKSPQRWSPLALVRESSRAAARGLGPCRREHLPDLVAPPEKRRVERVAGTQHIRLLLCNSCIYLQARQPWPPPTSSNILDVLV